MNLYILIPGTFLIMLFSWFVSIKHGRYHGIARFFSFESIFMLVLLNAGVWFKNPLSLLQILSWLILLLSLYIAIAGFLLLRQLGKPQGGNFENTSVIVRSGLYRHIRHPLYLALFLLGTGAMLKDPSLLQIALGALNLASVWLTARMEEKEMVGKFGDEYVQYMGETKMFIPFIL